MDVREAIDRADELRREKRFDDAAAVLGEALASASPADEAELHYRLGNVRIDSGDLDGAEAEYAACLALDARHADAMNNLAVVYKRQGRRSLFAKTYRRALWLTAKNPRRRRRGERGASTSRGAPRWLFLLGLALAAVVLLRLLSSR